MLLMVSRYMADHKKCCLRLLRLMLARFGEEICQIHVPAAVLSLMKTDGPDNALIFLYKGEILKVGLVHTAKVDKVQCTAPHHKEGFHTVLVREFHLLAERKVADIASRLVHGELANTCQRAVDQALISKAICIVGDAASAAYGFLLHFDLYGKNF